MKTNTNSLLLILGMTIIITFFSCNNGKNKNDFNACDCQSHLGDFVKRNPHATFNDLEQHQKELEVWAKKCAEKYPNYEKSADEWEPYTHLCEQGK